MTETAETEDVLMRATDAHAAPPASRLRASNLRHLSAVTETTTKPAELCAGDVLEGRYTLLSALGEGGMGDVWLAHNAMLDVRVALKVLRVDDNHPERRAKLTQRLLLEARAAAKLDNPAIVRISDFGETPSGNGFFVMELLEGEDLHALLERHGRLSTTKAVRTLLPIASGLVAAHAKNIVHRDLKPENIFLARNEERGSVQPKLIDFGVAKQKLANERITVAGTVMGSPGYMAPEQARGEDVDERADVWGFSVVLYETITGRLPFEGKNYNALMRSIIEDVPSPITRFGVGDDALSEIIERGLAKDPDKRWQTMRALGVALASWLLQRQISEDICGTLLATAWMRSRTEASTDSASPPDPFVSGSIPGAVLGEARRQRAELTTEPPPPLSVSPAQGSEAASPKVSFVRSRPIAVAALVLGTLGGIAFGGWAIRRSVAPPQALPEAPSIVSTVSSQRASALVESAPAVELAPAGGTSAVVAARPSSVHSNRSPAHKTTAPAAAAPPAPTPAAKSPPASAVLKNPF